MEVFGTNRPSHPDPVLSPGRRSAPAGPVAWGLCPLARRKGSPALDRDGLPSLPRGCVFPTLAMASIRLCRPGDPPPSRSPLHLAPPGLADGQGCSAALRFNPSP